MTIINRTSLFIISIISVADRTIIPNGFHVIDPPFPGGPRDDPLFTSQVEIFFKMLSAVNEGGVKLQTLVKPGRTGRSQGGPGRSRAVSRTWRRWPWLWQGLVAYWFVIGSYPLGERCFAAALPVWHGTVDGSKPLICWEPGSPVDIQIRCGVP